MESKYQECNDMLARAVPGWPLTASDLQCLLQVAIMIDPYASLDGQLAIYRKIFNLTILLRTKGNLPQLNPCEEAAVDAAFEAADLAVANCAPPDFLNLEYATSVIDKLALTVFPNPESLIIVLGLVENDGEIIERLLIGDNNKDIQLNWGTLSTSVLSVYLLACARDACRYGQGMEHVGKWGKIDSSFKSAEKSSVAVEKLKQASFGWVFRVAEIASKLESLFQSDETLPGQFASVISASTSTYRMMVEQTVAKLGLLGPPPVPDQQDLILTASIIDHYGPAAFI